MTSMAVIVSSREPLIFLQNDTENPPFEIAWQLNQWSEYHLAFRVGSQSRQTGPRGRPFPFEYWAAPDRYCTVGKLKSYIGLRPKWRLGIYSRKFNFDFE
jgi:hypothetical protein